MDSIEKERENDEKIYVEIHASRRVKRERERKRKKCELFIV